MAISQIIEESWLSTENLVKLGVGLSAVGLGVWAVRSMRRKKSQTRRVYKLIESIAELNTTQVRIKDPERVELILTNLKQSGKDTLQVVSDFDRTISLCSYNGQSCPTSFGIIENSEYINEPIRNELNKIFNYYYPIEHDHSKTKEEKMPYMVEWWEKSNELIVSTGLSRDDLRHIIQNSMTHLKHNCKSFFRALEAHDIPCLVFSAGLGDVIEEWIEHECGLYRNMKIVSNFMDFDEETNRIKGFRGKIIHIFNKNEGVLLDTDYEKTIHNRPNVILLGDSLGDIEMANGFPSLSNVLKIGFLNTKVDVLLPEYMESFDIVLIQDDTFDVPNAILSSIL